MFKSHILAAVTGVAALGAVASGSSQAATLAFGCITSTNATNCSAGEAQLSVDVFDLGYNARVAANQVKFIFNNAAGGAASSITDVYFDDGTLLGIAGLQDKDDGSPLGDQNVDFSQGASPPNLPLGNSIDPAFQVTAGFLADSDNGNPGVSANGVNPGEWLGVIFNLQPGKTYAEMYSALTAGNNLEAGDDPTGTLRVGMHVQSFSGAGSESFVSNGFAVPLPAAVWLLGSALVGFGMTGRRNV